VTFKDVIANTKRSFEIAEYYIIQETFRDVNTKSMNGWSLSGIPNVCNIDRVRIVVFNTTFNNISVVS
jgi:hypothetical protein